MKILQLSNKVPFPEKDGGALGISVFTNALLQAGHQVRMIAMNTSRQFIEPASIPQKLKDAIKLEIVYVDTSIMPVHALLTLLKGKSYNISRFISQDFKDKLSSVLKAENFDVIQLEGLYLAPYISTIKQLSQAPIIMRAHNIEWMIWQRLASEEKNFIKAFYIKKLTAQLKKYEEASINLCAGITTTTANDMQRLKEMGCKVPIAHIPFGIDTSKYNVSEPEKETSLFYIGALDWQPNIQGLDWFLKQVWPKVHSTLPALEFHIAGRNMPATYKNASYPNVFFHGEVNDAQTFINTHEIMLVPLLAGSGVRVKIIEGLAMGKPIITTSIGLEGINCTNGTDIMVADTPEDFQKAITYCIENPRFTKSLSENARRYALKEYDIHAITGRLVQFYEGLINAKSNLHNR